MSSGGGAKPFFCYKCNRRVTVSDASDPFCPTCLEGFLEECQNADDPNSNPNPNPFLALDPFSFLPLMFSSAASSTAIDLHNPRFFSNAPASGTRSHFPDSDVFDPFLFLQNHLRGLQAGGATVEFEINHPSGPDLRLPANIGDYFLGPGLEQLIQQLVENDPNRYGTPPASKSAIENLPTVTVNDELLSSEMNQCAVCQDDFEKGSQVKEMPCKHVYHDGCLLPWLKLHNSCPVCRYELPSDDADCENQTHSSQGNTSGGSRSDGNGSGGGVGEGNRPVHRTFRISLRYPFGSRGPDQESSRRQDLD